MEINVIKGVLKQKKEASSSHARTMCVSMREVVRLSQDFKVCHKKNRVWWKKRVIFFFSSCLTKIKNFFHLETQKKLKQRHNGTPVFCSHIKGYLTVSWLLRKKTSKFYITPRSSSQLKDIGC